MDLQTIYQTIPHRPPFLFVDRIISWDDQRILCEKTFSGEENFFQGHYPGNPIVPGVLLCEAAMQTGAIFLSKLFREKDPSGKKAPVVAKMGEVRFKKIIRPGDTITTEVEFRESMGSIYFMKAKIKSAQELVARFEFACTATEINS